MFEYLLERGAVVPSIMKSDTDAAAVRGLMQRRESWVVAAKFLAHECRVSLTAVRTIHEYVVGFNWSVVCEAIVQLPVQPLVVCSSGLEIRRHLHN